MHQDDSPAAELWTRTLSQISTVFGRLVYLTSLRDSNTGLYHHFGFEQRFGAREADKTMRRSHQNTFADWLCFSVEEQKRDLDRYLGATGEETSIIVENWVRHPPFANFIPARTREPERDLYLADMKILLELLRREYSVALPGPDA
jgi:hypothetical protein